MINSRSFDNTPISSAKLETISNTLKVYQMKGVFSYGTDAVLLSAYTAGKVKFSSDKTAFDLCSGTGIIGLMLLDYFRSTNCLTVNGLEINETACELSEMSAKESNLSERYFIHNTDIKKIKDEFSPDTADFITVNPPYMTPTCGLLCDESYKNIARHEVLCNLKDIFAAAFHLLKTGGSLFVVYRPDRLSTLFDAAKSTKFEIKNMTFVHSKKESESKLVLCQAKKNAKEGLHITRPLVIYDENGNYTEDYINIRDKGVICFD